MSYGRGLVSHLSHSIRSEHAYPLARPDDGNDRGILGDHCMQISSLDQLDQVDQVYQVCKLDWRQVIEIDRNQSSFEIKAGLTTIDRIDRNQSSFKIKVGLTTIDRNW